MPKGHPSWVGMDKVPTEDNSRIVLETSAGNGLPLPLLVKTGSETTETAHLRDPIENLGRRKVNCGGFTATLER